MRMQNMTVTQEIPSSVSLVQQFSWYQIQNYVDSDVKTFSVLITDFQFAIREKMELMPEFPTLGYADSEAEISSVPLH